MLSALLCSHTVKLLGNLLRAAGLAKPPHPGSLWLSTSLETQTLQLIRVAWSGGSNCPEEQVPAKRWIEP